MPAMILKQPYSTQSVFNQATFMLQDVGYEPSLLDYSTLTLISGDKPIATLKKEYFNQFVTFDLSNELRKLFSDKIEYIYQAQNSYQDPDYQYKNIYRDSNLFIKYKVEFEETLVGNPGFDFEYMGLNAVVQVGEDTVFSLDAGRFLTGFEQLKYYKGYPMDISVLSYFNGSYVNFDGERVSKDLITDIHFTIQIPPGREYIALEEKYNVPQLITNAGQTITDNKGNTIGIRGSERGFDEIRLPITNMCIPKNPCWVRWINRTANWDYWMFSKRQYVERGVENQESMYPAIFDVAYVNSTTQVIKEEGYENITVGADMLNRNEYDNISKIVYSPKIQYYNEALGKWLQLTKNDISVTNDTHAESNSIELTFSMPKIQMQY